MPVRASALEAAGVGRARASRSRWTTRATSRRADDPLPVLGDVLPVPLTDEVLSFGDLIVIVGAADAVRELSRRRARAPAAATAQRPARMASASVDQVWGTAPSGAPVSATQCSANPERSTPGDHRPHRAPSRPPSEPELVAASQSR